MPTSGHLITRLPANLQTSDAVPPLFQWPSHHRMEVWGPGETLSDEADRYADVLPLDFRPEAVFLGVAEQSNTQLDVDVKLNGSTIFSSAPQLEDERFEISSSLNIAAGAFYSAGGIVTVTLSNVTPPGGFSVSGTWKGLTVTFLGKARNSWA